MHIQNITTFPQKKIVVTKANWETTLSKFNILRQIHIQTLQNKTSLQLIFLFQPFQDGNRLLHVASRRGDKVLVSALIKGGADVNLENNVSNTLWWLVLYSFLNGLVCLFCSFLYLLLFVNGLYKVNWRTATYILLIGVIKFYILRATCKHNYNWYFHSFQDGNSPLHIASRLGKIDIVTMLLEGGADIKNKVSEIENLPRDNQGEKSRKDSENPFKPV